MIAAAIKEKKNMQICIVAHIMYDGFFTSLDEINVTKMNTFYICTCIYSSTDHRLSTVAGPTVAQLEVFFSSDYL